MSTIPDDIDGAMFRYLVGDDKSELALLKAQLEHMGGVLSREIELNQEARATIDRLRKALEQISLMPDPQDEWDGLAAFRKAKRLAMVAVAVSDADRG